MTETTLPTQQGPQNFHPVIKRLFEKKGLDQDGISEFLSWNLKQLPDLTTLLDIDKASARIIKALDNNELIGIYGDYDVDGTTSCALFYHFFKMLGHKVETIQPSRFIEGYGIHPPSIDKAIEKGIKLLITVDCGITNNEAADHALEKGLDLIITDHHNDARDEMPKAFAIVNPSRRDEPKDSPLKPLAGVAVAFAVCVKVREDLIARGDKVESIYPLLQFAAIGTICDLAKLTPMNMKIVRHGLHQIPATQYYGVRAFFTPDERKRGFVPSEKLSFNIGPLINSKGRLDHPEKALQLLLAEDSSKAFEYYSHLDVCNKERKFIQAEVFSEAKEQVLRTIDGDSHYISIVYAPHWHEGVIGIVASKLVEEFKVPAIVFSDSESTGIIKASARSAGDLSIFDCLKANDELFIKFGGHKAAAGLSMDKDNLEEFRTRMNAILVDIPAIERTVQKSYDIEISAEDINPQLLKELEKLEPYGMGNEKPVFKMKGFKLDSYDLMKEIHVRWNISSIKNPNIRLKGISFNYVGKWGIPHPEELFSQQNMKGVDLTAYFTLGLNHFNGNQYIQLMVDKITAEDF